MKVYNILAVTENFGTVEGKSWKGMRAIVNVTDKENGKITSCSTKIYKVSPEATQTVTSGAVGTADFDEYGRLTNIRK